MDYYKLPMQFTRFFETNVRDLARCSEEESIDQYIELIITTCPGEHKYDPEFGCHIWELDFEKVVSLNQWEGKFIEFIKEALEKYEPRISHIVPHVRFLDIRHQHEITEAISIRKRADIQIDATVVKTGKRCCFYYSLYIGPLSSD